VDRTICLFEEGAMPINECINIIEHAAAGPTRQDSRLAEDLIEGAVVGEKVASHYRYGGAFHGCGEMRGTSVYDASTGKADPVQSRAGYPHIKLLRCTACQQNPTIRPLLTVE
jgi:hypothetical protein